MRKLVVAEGLSLDGVMQAPGDPDEDRSGGFDHGGWQMPYFDEVAGEAVGKSMAETGAFLFGRRTYEIMAAHWPNAPEGDMFAEVLKRLAEVRGLEDAPGATGVGELASPRGKTSPPPSGNSRSRTEGTSSSWAAAISSRRSSSTI